jgi:glucan biosynthesis protein C
MVRDRFQRIGIPFIVGLFVFSPLVIAGADFAVYSRDGGLAAGWARALAVLSAPQNYLPERTHHLWFLYYLLYFYMATAALYALCRVIPAEMRAGLTRRFGMLVARPVLRVVVPGAVTAAMFFFLGGFMPSDEALLPSWLNLLAYFTFFGFGLLLHAERHVLPTFTRFAWSQVIAATSLYLVMMLWALPRAGGWLSGPVSTLVVSLTGGFIAWILLFGLTGLFLRYCNRPSPYVRYFVDASYWIYLTHYAFAFWLPGLVANTGLSVWERMAFVICGMCLIGLVTYATLVRSSFIGAVLNGRRNERGRSVRDLGGGLAGERGLVAG